MISVQRPSGLHTTIRLPPPPRGPIHTLTFALPPFAPGAYRLTLTATTSDHQVATAYAPLLLLKP